MSKYVVGIIFFFLIFHHTQLSAQCPTITSTLPDEFLFQVCPGDEVTYMVEGNDLPGGGTIDWYANATSPFNPYLGQGTLVGQSDITGGGGTGQITPCLPCPQFLGALIDACAFGSSGEADNEFFMFSSGGGFNIDDFSIDLPTENNSLNSNDSENGDMNINNSCNWQTPTPFLMNSLASDAGCGTTFVAAGPGTLIPPDVIVLVFPSSAQGYNMDFSLFCATGNTAYVVQSDCDRSIGALSNAASTGLRTYQFAVNCGCNETWIYDTDDPSLQNADGAFVTYDAQTGQNVFSNSGCVTPPADQAAPPAPTEAEDFTYTFDDTFCGGSVNIVGVVNPLPGNCNQTSATTFNFSYQVLCPVDALPASLSACDEGFGQATFDLTSLESTINGGNGQDVFFYFLSDGTGQIFNETAYPSFGGTIYASVGSQQFNPCPGALSEITLTVTGAGTAAPASLAFCDDGSSSFVFDLTNATDVINGGSGETVNFFEDQAGQNSVSDPSNYVVGATTTVYATVGSAPCESDPVEVDLIINTGGEANITGSAEFCQGTNNDLTITFTDATAPFSFTLLEDGANPVDYTNISDNPFTITVSPTGDTDYTIENATDSAGCDLTETGTAELTLADPVSADFTATPSSACAATDVTLTFNLSGQGVHDVVLAVSAPPGSTPVLTNYSLSDGETVTINITETSQFQIDSVVDEAGCVNDDNFDLTVDIGSPPSATASSLSACNDGNGGASFNLNDANDAINGGSGEEVNYFSDSSASTAINEADQSDFAVTGTTTVYANIGSGNCSSSIVELELIVEDLISAEITGDATTCTGDATTLQVSFTNGTAPYSFVLLTNSGSPQPFNNLTDNPYEINVSPFFDSEYTIINASAGDCEAEEVGSATVTVTSPPQATISGDATTCSGDAASIQIDFTGDAPYTFVYEIGGTLQPETQTNDNPYILNVSPTNTTTYTLDSFSDNECAGTVSGSAQITVNPEPTAEFTGGGSVCQGESFDLEVNFTGNGPWTFVYAENSVEQTGITTNDNPYTLAVSPSTDTEYSLTSVEANNCPGNITGTAVNVNVYPEIQAVAAAPDCSNDGLTYTISFTLSGGTEPYTVSGGTGTLDANNEFTSDPIAEGTVYNFTITDANDCSIDLSGSANCDPSCTTYAGTMELPQDPIAFCFGEQIEVNTVLPPALDNDDIRLFYIHDSPDNTLGTVYAVGNTPSFPWSAGSFPLNTVLYISSGAGNEVTSDSIDLADNCFDLSLGTPIILYESPDLSVGIPPFCAGDDYFVTVNVTGEAPYSITYSANGGAEEVLQFSESPVNIDIPDVANPSFSYTAYSDANCAVQVSNSFNLQINQPVSVTVTDTICAQDITTYQIEFEVVGQAPFTVMGDGGIFNGNVFTSVPITNSETYFFEISDVYNCNSVIVEGIYECEYVCSGELGMMSSDGLELCVGETASASYDASNESIEPGDLTQYIIHSSPGTSLGNPVLQQNSPDFEWDADIYDVNTTYYISVISGDDDGSGNVDLDDPCLLVIEGQPVIWNQPTATLLTTDASLCEGDCIDVTVQFTGVGTFGANFISSLGTSQTISDFNDEVVLNICPDATATYTLSDVTAGTCAGITIAPEELTLTVLAESSTSIQETYCPGDSLVVGTQVFNESNPLGQVVLDNEAGCDSVVTVNLSFYDLEEGSADPMVCTGGSFTLGGVIFDASMPTGSVVLENASVNGCDSIVNVSLTFTDNIVFDLDTIICEGQSVVINGETYDAGNTTGSFTFTDGSYLGCDSTVNVTLSFYDAPETTFITETYCDDTSITVGTEVFDSSNPSGTVILNDINGCDSTVVVDLTYAEPSITELEPTLCAGESILINGQTIDEDNPTAEFTFPGMAFNGCDSVVTVAASFNEVSFTFIDEVLQTGESITVGTTVFDEGNLSGEVVFENGNFAGCDSTVVVNISYELSIVAEGNSPTCFGDSDGAIIISEFAGNAPFEVSLDNSFVGLFSQLPIVLSNLESGEYSVQITDNDGNTGSSDVLVPQALEYVLELGDNREIFLGETVTLSAQTNMTEIAILEWTPQDSLSAPDSLITDANPLETTFYSLYLEDSLGCSVRDIVSVFVNEERQVFVPTAFSPNDDGVNDYFTIFGGFQLLNIKSLTIYDRWGNQVFFNENLNPNVENQGWDGRFNGDRMNTQVFVYVAELEFIDGKTEVFKGDVSLLR